ncbi:trypsin-like peptidase domain-containing protein [Mucilaginibacter calamicampi]|uniref:Trypsin-like peptidase domain-containing protein n=1 Tax=Mucilaginibacter calamicampi TaxID=1302352 RepID=A0ABW2Z466_9SPHI
MSESQLLENIERYYSGEMNATERKEFEAKRKADAGFDAKVVEHQLFAGLLKQYSERVELENRLNAIHQEIDVHDLKESLMAHPSWVVRMWRNHHSKISVAASVAIFAALSILFATGKFESRNNIEALNRKVDQLDRSNANLKASIRDIKSQKATPADRYSSTGTGFAITSDGLIATNYHVVRDADSVYVQNEEGKSFKAKVLYTEPQHDVAILKIVDESFTNLGTIPYAIRRAESSIAEQLFTYGYPGGTAVYRNGYLASKSGFRGDSIHYEIDIPINPGNSGSPLLDSKGNVVGITDAKQSQFEGAHYAIKSKYLLDAISNIPEDSLSKKITLSKKNSLAGLSSVDKIEKVKKFTFMVKIYAQ